MTTRLLDTGNIHSMKIQFITALACASFLTTFTAESPLAEHLQKGLFEEEANHNLDAAISEYTKIISESDQQRRIIATALTRLAECYRKLGKEEEARKITERLARDYSEFQPPGFKTRLNAVVATNSASHDELVQKLARLREQEADLRTKYADSNASAQAAREQIVRQIQEIELRLAAQTPGANSSGKNPFSRDTLTENLARLRERETQLRQIFSDNSQSVQEVRQQIANTERLLSEQRSPEENYLAELGRLLDNSPDLLNAPATNSITFLQLAAATGDTDMIDFLLKRGAKVDRVSPAKQDTPLSIAVTHGYKRAAELLIKGGANVNYGDSSGWTPLSAAAGKGFVEMTTLLLDNGADINPAGAQRVTPIDVAAGAGQAEEIVFLAKHGAKVNTANSYGMTPLFTAVRSDHPEAVAALLDAGAELKAPANRLLLFAATVNGRNPEILSMLLARGADPNVQDGSGNTPLIQAVDQHLLPLVRLLLENKADVNLQNNEGDTALHCAIRSADTDIAPLLLEHGANPNIRNRHDRAPLHFAAGGPPDSSARGLGTYNGHLIPNGEKVRLLLAHNADPNVTDVNGMTPLRYAVQNYDSGVVELLLKAHASIPEMSVLGLRTVTTGNEAADARRNEIVKLLNQYAPKTNGPAEKEVK